MLGNFDLLDSLLINFMTQNYSRG